ncbi:MAG: NTP transferase domain-containing protein [Burkholderiales bacterium]|nr:NTP transferase domain-containing protein [Burkholderiales bacterium]MBH2017733.1 NTP transferase domain-containing protein [Burkholderiales bacterium]
MDTPTTVIILALPDACQRTVHPVGDAASWSRHNMITQMQRAFDSQLPVVLVAPDRMLTVARQWAPNHAFMGVSMDGFAPAEGLCMALRAGVQTSAMARGWIMLPVDMAMLRPGTLQAISDQLQDHLIAYPTHNNQQGLPIGFGRELFSELIQLRCNRDLLRLINRYPSRSVELNDPGVLMHPWSSISAAGAAAPHVRRATHALRK